MSRCMALSVLSLCTCGQTPPSRPRVLSPGPLLRFVAVQVFECFQFLDKGFVLVFQHGHAVLQTLDVLLLLPATLPGRLPVVRLSNHHQYAAFQSTLRHPLT